MFKAIFSPITLAIIGLTLITLAASNASENEAEKTEQMLKELIEAETPASAETKKPAPKAEPAESETAQES